MKRLYRWLEPLLQALLLLREGPRTGEKRRDRRQKGREGNGKRASEHPALGTRERTREGGSMREREGKEKDTADRRPVGERGRKGRGKEREEGQSSRAAASSGA